MPNVTDAMMIARVDKRRFIDEFIGVVVSSSLWGTSANAESVGIPSICRACTASASASLRERPPSPNETNTEAVGSASTKDYDVRHSLLKKRQRPRSREASPTAAGKGKRVAQTTVRRPTI